MSGQPARENARAVRHGMDARLAQSNFDQSPFVVAWEITRACALACLHCRAEAQPSPDPDQLTYEEAIGVIDQIAEIGNPILVVTGGDPLMRRDVYDLLTYAVQKGLRTSLTPSATALATRKNLDRVRETGVSRIAISLDGPTAEVHDRFRGFSGSFERTRQIMRDVIDCGLSLQINTTVSRYNLGVLEQMPDIVAEAQAVQWSVFFLVPTGRGQQGDMVSPEDHERLFNWLYDHSRSAPFDGKSTAAPAYRRVAVQRAQNEQTNGDSSRPIAGAGYRFQDGLHRPTLGVNDGNGFCFISNVGEVCPSGFLPLSAGNVRNERLADLYRNSQLFRDLRDARKLKGKCSACDFKNVCGGSRARAWAVNGDYLAEDPSCVYSQAEGAA